MSRNGPLALCYHALFTAFMLAPILVVCFVAFTPEGYLSFPTDRWSLRWFTAIGRYPEFIRPFGGAFCWAPCLRPSQWRSPCRRRLPSRAIASLAARR